ncbi:unnamed protein product [Arabidopsis halleri]
MKRASLSSALGSHLSSIIQVIDSYRTGTSHSALIFIFLRYDQKISLKISKSV